MRTLLPLILTCFTLAACATASHDSTQSANATHGGEAWDHALDLAVADMSDPSRLPASEVDLTSTIHPDFQGLRRELKVVVLPKRSNQTEKSRAPLEIEYGPAMTYTFHATRLVPCKKLVREKINGSPHIEVFGEEAAASGADCAILNVKRTYPELRPAEYRHDLIAMTVYLDSQYRGYGLETQIGHDRKDIERNVIKLNPSEGVSSGLSLFPVDLPSPGHMARAQLTAVSLPTDAYALKQLGKAGASLGCTQGYEVRHRDAYGSPVRTVWCPGSRWPSLVETRRFLAVTKN